MKAFLSKQQAGGILYGFSRRVGAAAMASKAKGAKGKGKGQSSDKVKNKEANKRKRRTENAGKGKSGGASGSASASAQSESNKRRELKKGVKSLGGKTTKKAFKKKTSVSGGLGDSNRDPAINDDVVELSDEDVDFVESLGKSSQGSFFLESLDRTDFSKSLPADRQVQENDIIEKYESKPRKTPQAQAEDSTKSKDKHRVPLLPVKSSSGLIEAAPEVEASPAPTQEAKKKKHKEDKSEESAPKKEEGKDDKGSEKKKKKEQATALKRAGPTSQQDYPSMKREIAIASVKAIESPESKGEASLKTLIHYARLQDPRVCQIAMLSLQAVFKDILPGYKIRADIDESSINLSKDVRKQHNYESMLLRSYQEFLRILFKKKKSGVKEVKVSACKCLCSLLKANANFNYQSDILKQVVPLMNSAHKEVSALSLECMEDVFRFDVGGETTLEVLQLVADFVRKNDCTLNGEMIEIMKNIRLSDDLTRKLLQAEEDDNVHISRKEKQRRALERRRKRDAALAEGKDVDYHLGSSTRGVKDEIKVQSKIIEAMFECFFRVLKNFKDGICEEDWSDSTADDVKKHFSWPLLSATLSCLAKYCMYINIDFMNDLFNWLYTIASEEVVPRTQKFQCLNAVYQILDGPGKALNIDTLRFDTRLYEILLEEKFLHREPTEQENLTENRAALAKAIQMALLFRRVMDRKRVINFVKRICMCSLHEPCSEEILSSAHLVGRLLQRYVSTRALLENDEANTVYNYGDFENTVDLHGRDTCPLWELSLLKHHYHPHVASSVTTILATASSDLLKEPSSILNVNDVGEIFEQYASRCGHFNPPPKPFKTTYRKINKPKR